MLHHHTGNPSERAASIADRVAEEEWREHHDYQLWVEAWFTTFSQALHEFSTPIE